MRVVSHSGCNDSYALNEKKTTRLSEGTTITTQAFGPLTYWSLKWKQLMLILHHIFLFWGECFSTYVSFTVRRRTYVLLPLQPNGLVTPRPAVPDKTMPDGARRSQMEPDGARQKNCCFCLTSWTRRFQEFLGTDCARRHQIFLFVYLTEGTDWLVSGVPGVKEADRNGQKRSGSVWHGFVWHGWFWCNQSMTQQFFLSNSLFTWWNCRKIVGKKHC